MKSEPISEIAFFLLLLYLHGILCLFKLEYFWCNNNLLLYILKYISENIFFYLTCSGYKIIFIRMKVIISKVVILNPIKINWQHYI